jgi:hypothetical protein
LSIFFVLNSPFKLHEMIKEIETMPEKLQGVIVNRGLVLWFTEPEVSLGPAALRPLWERL